MPDYEKLKNEIRRKLGIDLHAYKEQQMRRRINQWLDRHHFAAYNQLLARLAEDPEHKAQFMKYLTINTSNFFRDTVVFETIENDVLPAISRNNRPRIWSAGASFGAEIYSIAILMAELRFRPALLLATDLDQVALQKAKDGIYSTSQAAGVPPKYLEKYFTFLDEETVAIQERLKKQVVFQHHDLLKDHYQRNFDLILCRNVFIYFTSETQHRLIRNFVQSLKPEGYFIVGSAEQIMDPGKFGLKRVSYCVYQKTDGR